MRNVGCTLRAPAEHRFLPSHLGTSLVFDIAQQSVMFASAPYVPSTKPPVGVPASWRLQPSSLAHECRRHVMSIYRGARRRLDDVHAVAREHGGTINGSADFTHLRRSQPVSALLPRTSVWLSDVPERFRPSALAVHFPRVANALCANWSDPGARGQYLHDLLTGGGRPNRKGFPLTVVRELQRLNAVHTTLCGLGRSLWDDPMVGDARSHQE
jgi:hypothetical protein